MEHRVKIAHVISSLGPGGAEMMLYKLVASMDPCRFENEVISMSDLGAASTLLQGRGVRVRSLGMSKAFPSPIDLFHLVHWLRQSRPALVQSWMYHADLFGGIAARYAGRPPVVWGIHNNNLERKMNKRRTLLVARTCARLSGILPTRIVCCSAAAQQLHSRLGYAPDKIEFIPNGFDVDEFKPDPGARLSVRRELGLSPDTLLIGLTSRYHPLKDIPNFLVAAARLVARSPDVHFVLCGPGLGLENQELLSSLDAAGLRRRCHLLGVRSDRPRLFASFDIATNTSLSEAFPLAVGEAMACGTPCVVTNTGDSAMLVGDSGRVVPTRDPEAFTDAWAELISSPDERRRLGIAARRRIEKLYSLSEVVRRYEDLYERILYASRRASSHMDSFAVRAKFEYHDDERRPSRP